MKKSLCLLMATVMSLSIVTPAFAMTLEERMAMLQEASGGGYTGTLTGYTTRIEGTLTQRGNDFYYVLPDGTDLKNGFVDGDYFCWNGTMAKKYPKYSNQAIYNTVYGGVDYSRYPYEASNPWTVLNVNDYKLKGIKPEVAQSTFTWMDGVAQQAVQMDERSRASYLANAVAGKLSYGISVDADDTFGYSNQDNYIYAAHVGIGRCQAYAELYSALCRKSGLAVTNVSGLASNGQSHMWNYVRVDGNWYYVDTTYLDTTGSSAYVLSTEMFSGYKAEAEAITRSIEGF